MNKKLIIPIVLVLVLSTSVLAFSFFEWYNEANNWLLTGRVTYDTSQTGCTDSDNGKDYNTKGTTTGLYWGRSTTRTDRCSWGDRLVEYYCSGDDIRYTSVSCENGCEDGACVSTEPTPTCTDSDGGKDYFTKGQACVGDTCLHDLCLVADELDLIKIKTAGSNQYELEFLDGDGNKAIIPFAYAYGRNNIKFGDSDDDLIITEGQIINRNDYFIVTDETDGFSYALRYKGADKDSDDSPVVKFLNLGDGKTIEKSHKLVNGKRRATLKLGGATFNVYSASDTSVNNFDIQVDLNGDGVVGTNKVNIETYAGAEIQLTDQSTTDKKITLLITTKDSEQYDLTVTTRWGRLRLSPRIYEISNGPSGLQSNTLVEYYCAENQAKSEQYICPNSCQDGACVGEECQFGEVHIKEVSNKNGKIAVNYITTRGIAHNVKAELLTISVNNGQEEITNCPIMGGGCGVGSSEQLTKCEAYTTCDYPAKETTKTYYIKITGTNCPDVYDSEILHSECTDTDGGIDYSTRGTANATDGSGGTDRCSDAVATGKGLVEVYCGEDGRTKYLTYVCPNSCQDGACVQEPVEELDLANYPFPFIEDNKFYGKIVVGNSATLGDTIAAMDIISRMQYDCGGNKIEVGAAMLASEVLDFRAQNIISIGSPCDNSATAEIIGIQTTDPECSSEIPDGYGLIKLYEWPNGKASLIVVGLTYMDTRRVGRVLANYDDYELSGHEICVSGSSLTDISVGACP